MATISGGHLVAKALRFPQHYRSYYKVQGYPKAIEQVAAWIKQAERVAVLAGSMERARASGRLSCVNVILDLDIYSSGTMNQTMYK
jgi:hypothetical protein